MSIIICTVRLIWKRKSCVLSDLQEVAKGGNPWELSLPIKKIISSEGWFNYKRLRIGSTPLLKSVHQSFQMLSALYAYSEEGSSCVLLDFMLGCKRGNPGEISYPIKKTIISEGSLSYKRLRLMGTSFNPCCQKQIPRPIKACRLND